MVEFAYNVSVVTEIVCSVIGIYETDNKKCIR